VIVDSVEDDDDIFEFCSPEVEQFSIEDSVAWDRFKIVVELFGVDFDDSAVSVIEFDDLVDED
jgi:hypothetical protein